MQYSIIKYVNGDECMFYTQANKNPKYAQWLQLKAAVFMCLSLWIIDSRLNAQNAVVDATTLYGKYMCGYQGWFRAAGDGSNQGWVHWFSSKTDPSTSYVRVDLFPDLREFEADELFSTNLHYRDGSTVKLYSPYIEKSVVRHFKWMKENDIDGVWVQRFTTPHIGLTDPTNRVLMNCRKGAETYGRVFVVMYDISNNKAATLVEDIKNDWMHLVDVIKITESPRYLQHKGKPLVSIWGFGCTGRPGTAQDAATLINWFKKDAPAKYQATFMGGINGSTGDTHWSLQPEPWASVYRSMDIISPWTIGRYSDETSADSWRANQMVPDMAEARRAGIDYLPVIFPGFSWHNMKDGPQNQTPRMGGRFFWRQAYNAIDCGANMLYSAMFDEVDEGTAMYKICPKRSMAPVEGYWLTLDADGYDLPSDWYLQLSGLAKKMLNKQIPLSKTMPLVPPPIVTKYELRTDILGEGRVQTEPSGTTFAAGTEVKLTAIPNSNWAFYDWLGDLNSTNAIDRLVMNSDKNVLATFYPSGDQIRDLPAIQDGYVRGGLYASRNFYGDSTLIVQESGSASLSFRSYLQFDLHSVTPTRPEVILVLRSKLAASLPAHVDLFASTSDAWNETTLTWQNAPEAATLLDARSDILNKNATYYWDVSDFVSSEINKDLVVSFMLKDQMVLGRRADFYSRENAAGPFLRLVTSSSSGISPKSILPSTCELKQNAPNPFNPLTVIEYSVPKSAHVKLSVFDGTGRWVSTLINEFKTSGNYRTVWNASNSAKTLLPSGVYICRLEIGSDIKSIKMLLLK
jgi:hypothetical protein